MLANILILAAASLTTIAHGAALPSIQADNTSTALRPVLADLDGSTARNISTRATYRAVEWTEHEGRECGGWQVNYEASDDGCYFLPTGDGFNIRNIADTCRVFIYQSNGCTGAEFQAYHGNCYDVHAFYSIKAFCG